MCYAFLKSKSSLDATSIALAGCSGTHQQSQLFRSQGLQVPTSEAKVGTTASPCHTNKQKDQALLQYELKGFAEGMW